MKQTPGFSLTELLMALMILSVISTFTIPKVISSQANAKKKAVFKEAIATLNEIFYLGNLKGEITNPLNDYIWTKLNAVRFCSTDSVTEGCWAHSRPASCSGAEEGAVLHNGLVIAGMGPNNGTGPELKRSVLIGMVPRSRILKAMTSCHYKPVLPMRALAPTVRVPCGKEPLKQLPGALQRLCTIVSSNRNTLRRAAKGRSVNR